MHWFRRPPYLRWTAALLLVAVAAWLDLRPEPTVLRPFAAVDLPAGVVIESAQIEWLEVDPDLLPDPGDPTGLVSRSIRTGEPLLPSGLAAERVTAPEGWWSLEARLPAGAYPGQNLQLIVMPADPGATALPVPGIVVADPPEHDPLAFEDRKGLVAVPGEFATDVAVAVAEGRITVTLGSPGSTSG